MTGIVDNQKMAVGRRIKEARAALGLTQKDLCALIEKPLPSLRDYELGKSIPGGEAVAGLVRAGINANWLLTGEGPMLISELSTMARVDMLLAERNELADGLQKALEKAWAAPAAPQSPRINVDVLASIIEGLLRTAPNAPPDKLGSVCASLYQDLIDKEMITPEGVGPGNQENAA